MKYKAILLLILSSILILSSKIPSTSIEVVPSWELDKEKRDLFRKLRVKTEIEIIKRSSETDSLQNSAWTHKNYYDKNGNRLRREFYTDSLMTKLYYEEDYVTDENGNILEAYREGKLLGTQEFDEEGRIIELVNYNEDGDSVWRYEYEYDSEGNLIIELLYLYEEPFDTIEFNAYEYITIGEEKLLVSKISLLPLSETLWESKLLYDYDSLGREIYYQEYGPYGKILQEKYRDFTSLTGYRKFYGLDGILKFIDSLKLNSDGNSIVIMRYENTHLINRIYREYNENEILLSEFELSPAGKKLLEWQYDESGKEIEFRRYENEVMNYRKIFDYLDNDLPTKKTTVDIKKGEIETREFHYDYYE